MSVPPAPDPAHELAREQAHLARARSELARMREHTLSLQADAGDKIAGEHLAYTLWQRAKALLDDPGSALFFGRVDLTDGSAARPHYIGRRHVSDPAGDPVVIDWRAEVSTAFYRASRTYPMGVVLRRRFGVDGGELTAYEDEHLLAPQDGDVDAGETGGSAILAREIERPRIGPMRDIVATIQPEQDQIVRADVSSTVCVQGAPGTGKTAVGLHRAAWLLYAFRERLSRTGVLVVGPNRAFLEHIGAVLPALGEIEVRHTTIEELVGDVPVRATDDPRVATLKGDARLADVLRRAVWARVGSAGEPLVVPRGARKWRVGAFEVQEILDELGTRGVRYDAARAMLPQRLAHAVLVRMERAGDTPDDRVQDAVARSKPVRDYVTTLWPRVDPRQVLWELWSSPGALAAAAGSDLTAEEQELLLWDRPPRTKGAARWTAADTVLLDELGDILERTPSLGHIVLDEAQDLSPMQLRAVGRRAATGSLTVLGDIAQGTTPWATGSWQESLRHLGKDGAHVEVLDRGFRVPAAVIEYAARLLPHMAPGLGAPVSVRENRGRLDLDRVAAADLVAAVVDRAAGLARQPGSVGLIVPDDRVAATARALTAAGVAHDVLGTEHDEVHQVQLVPATVAKGLEFDRVIVVEPAAIAAAEPDERTGLRRLYVVLTRAVSGLTVLHAEPLPGPLA
ncbi:HelD family protein [Ornithinicoccus hortensis]|uniref:DNA helicase IV n=1 Tax=Ornithinicoccus hortensis TaxID=82346 RepID=A0A542YP54_9MICO|nr:AAA family ATPase [Ornithinicoccus hortensis]TQL49885.1 DNA helicase IV [Ornithinicoccus hortensis]